MLTNVTLSSKRQMTIPKRVADAFGLKAGDQIAVSVRRDSGEIILRPRIGDITKLFGILADVKIPKGKTVDDLIDESRQDYLTRKYQRLGLILPKK